MKIAFALYFAACLGLAWICTGQQVSITGKGQISGSVSLGQSILVDVISDEHVELDPLYSNQETLNLSGNPLTSPTHIINRVRADNPNYIIVNGDLGHNSLPYEYNGLFAESSTAVATTGSPHTISINCSPGYTEYGQVPHQDLHVYGSADQASNVILNNKWVAVYNDITGAGFEIVQVSSVTSNTCPTSSTFSATFTKTHPAGFLIRAHAMAEYWDYMLAGKVVMSDGNHDVNCNIADAATYNYAVSGCGSVTGPQSVLTYLQFGFQNSSTFPFAGYSNTSPFGNYYSRVVHPLLGVIAIDSMAGQYTGGGGTGYGGAQELALRCALSGGTGTGCGGAGALAATWVVTTQHYGPANTCGEGQTAPWAMNAGVDMSLFGHEHLSQYVISPRCGGSGCTNVTGPGGATSIPVLDVSGYTWMNDSPLTGGQGCPPGTAGTIAPVPSNCPSCTRQVLNSSAWENAGDGLATLQVSYVKMLITAHSLNWAMINNSGAVVCDYATPTNCAQGTLTK